MWYPSLDLVSVGRGEQSRSHSLPRPTFAGPPIRLIEIQLAAGRLSWQVVTAVTRVAPTLLYRLCIYA